MNEETLELITQVATLAGIEVGEDVYLETLPAGLETHVRANLPAGHSAVYIFEYQEQTFKVGHCGLNTNPCFNGRHYGFNFPSTLAKSLMADNEFNHLFDKDTVGDWIKENTTRSNIFVPEAYGNYLRYFIEAFLILKLHPRYERKGN